MSRRWERKERERERDRRRRRRRKPGGERETDRRIVCLETEVINRKVLS